MQVETHGSIDSTTPKLSRRVRLTLLVYLVLSSGAALYAASAAVIAEWRERAASAISAPASRPLVSRDRPTLDILTAGTEDARNSRMKAEGDASERRP